MVRGPLYEKVRIEAEARLTAEFQSNLQEGDLLPLEAFFSALITPERRAECCQAAVEILDHNCFKMKGEKSSGRCTNIISA